MKRIGLTLIELIVVLTIIVIITVSAAISFSGLAGTRLEADARKMVSDLSWARQMAVAGHQYLAGGSSRQNYIVVFDTVNEFYAIYYDLNGNGNPDAATEEIKRQNLGGGVDLNSIAPAAPGGLTFTFPQGTLLEAGPDWTITLNSQGKTRLVRIFRNTGYVRIQ